MPKRPISIIVVSYIYIAAGTLGIAYHLRDLRTIYPVQFDVFGILLLRILAIVAGIYMLGARNWARWLALAWMAFHVTVSFFHSRAELAVHGVLLVVFAYLLLRRTASEYFRPAAKT